MLQTLQGRKMRARRVWQEGGSATAESLPLIPLIDVFSMLIGFMLLTALPSSAEGWLYASLPINRPT